MSSALLHRNLRAPPRRVTSSEGSFITLDDGQVILDATGGAAVSCLGHAHPRVLAAMRRQAEQVAYCHSLFFGTEAAEELARELCDGTGGAMTRAFIVSSGRRFLFPLRSNLYKTAVVYKRHQFAGVYKSTSKANNPKAPKQWTPQ
jgi:acetylornithine/succinyldiaminopimelate/putrescine aminotransferase